LISPSKLDSSPLLNLKILSKPLSFDLKGQRNRFLSSCGTDAFARQANLALLNPAMICPHLQPFSLGRRELEFMIPLLGERARVRADFAIQSFTNAANLTCLARFS